MMWNGNGHWSSGDWATLALIVIAVIAVIVAIVFLVRYLGRTGGTSSATVPAAPASGQESPEDILKRRYAAGEIDREEYLQRNSGTSSVTRSRRKDLRGPTHTDAGIMKAVTQGLDPAGSRLEAPMPQWQLTVSAWGDLLAYLKTLH